MSKTALVLGGGGSRGAYEIGVWKALNELGIEIHMVMGTSVGAINGALVVQDDFDICQKLWQQLETEMIFDVEEGELPAEKLMAYGKKIILEGGAGTDGLSAILHKYVDEAKVRSSQREYGLVTTEYPGMHAHYLMAHQIPEGKLIDYILASASCFPAAKKCEIDGKLFIDGGYRDNVPVEMAMDNGADVIIAVDLQAAGFVRKAALEQAERQCEFHLIRSCVDLGNFLIFDQANSKRLLRLGYMDAMKHFGHFDGDRFCFRKGSFSKHDLIGAECAAQRLGLDPCHVYDQQSLCTSLAACIERLSDNIYDDFDIRGQMLRYIATSLIEEEAKSPFMQPALFSALEEDVKAANFLVKFGLM